MPRCRTVAWLVGLGALCVVGTLRISAQDLGNLQVHGFATQGFLYSSNNNYLTMDSSSGSLRWSEAAISLNDPVTENLRFGIQLHMFQMGQIGSPYIFVDWALVDYKVNDAMGFRIGKVKIPIGLYNDSQDVDSLFLWVLLPEDMYPIDNRDFNLAALGGEVYGGLSLGKQGGRVQYSGYLGENTLDSKGGYMQQFEELGLSFPNPPSGKTFGGDVRWVAPWGLTVGASANDVALDGTGPQGSFHFPATLFPRYYAQWQYKKLQVAGEYQRSAYTATLTVQGMAYPLTVDARSWYPMASYRVLPKLQVGTYYSHNIDKASDPSQPYSYSKDWVVSGRYDFNQYFYGKLEGHFLHGTGLGYYTSDNPNGLKSDSNMLAARVGFSF
jgi:hypothetical protein